MPTRTQTGIFDNEASAVAFDGLSSITKNQFCTMLDKTSPLPLATSG